jgi:hypothetical protein
LAQGMQKRQLARGGLVGVPLDRFHGAQSEAFGPFSLEKAYRAMVAATSQGRDPMPSETGFLAGFAPCLV